MYSKEQASKLRQQFWTRFGLYMKPVPGAGGEAVNWLNYKTGKKHLSFRLDATKEQASITIEIKHTVKAEREKYYQQLLALKNVMESETGYLWQWEKEMLTTTGEVISTISQTLPSVNVLNENDWPVIIAFLKPRMMALDAFWDLVKDGFE